METGKPFFGRYIGRKDIEQMSETPRRGSHRRAQSETFFRLPSDDEILFDADADFSIPDLQPLPPDPDTVTFPSPMESATKSDQPNGGDASPKARAAVNGVTHFRSLSVDDAFFDNLGIQAMWGGGEGRADKQSGESGGGGVHERRVHRHSNSMDGSLSSLETDSLPSDFTKKAMAADKLAELALIDPRRAKRILANRQSAARSKERKTRYTSELERKVQTLQTEATTLSAQLTLLQRDTTGLTTENKELKLRLQAMEQQAHLRDALNEALREEVQRLRIATGEVQNVSSNSFNRGLQQLPPFFAHSQPMHHIGGSQTQPLHVAQSSSNGPRMASQSPHALGSMDFIRGTNNNL